MTCKFCGKKVILTPTAKERAAGDTSGKTAAYYTRLFTDHAECAVADRERQTVELMRRLRALP